MLTKSDFLARFTPPKPESVPIPGAGDVLIARMNARAADEYAKDLKAAADDLARGTILTHAVVDESGKRLFATADAATLADLLGKPVADLIIDEFADLNELNGKKA